MESTLVLNLEKYILTPDEKKYYEGLVKPYGVKILPASEYDIPKDYTFPDNISEYDKQLFGESIDAYKNYLGLPIISDNFKDHKERRLFRKRIQRKLKTEQGDKTDSRFSQFLGDNKMKRGRMSTILGYTHMLKELEYIPDQLADNLITLIHHTEGYNPITNLENAVNDPNSPYFNDPEVIDFLQKVKNEEIDKPNYVDPWDGPTTPDKIERVNQISNAVADILNYLGRTNH